VGVDHIGRVIEATIVGDDKGRCSVRVAIELSSRPLSKLKVWGPVAFAATNSWDGSELTVFRDYYRAGNGHSDAKGFTKPDWCPHPDGNLRVNVYQGPDGRHWPANRVAVAEVTAADPDASTLSLTVISGRIFRDMWKCVLAAPYSQQTAPWAQQIYIPITNPDGTYDGVNKGTRLK
jgi:hypothetical protein